MRSNILFVFTSLVTLLTLVQASPMPTAAPIPLEARQDSGEQTTAPITSTIDPSQGISGNGCSSGNNGQPDNIALCCPGGYSVVTTDSGTTCVKIGTGGANGGVSGGDDSGGSGENDGSSDSSAAGGSATTISGGNGVTIVSGGSLGSIGGQGGFSQSTSNAITISDSTSVGPTTTSSSSSSNHNDVGRLSVPYTLAAIVGAAIIAMA